MIDYSAIKEFCRKNDVSNDAVFVNGNSGDFITGGHIGTYIPDGAGNNIDSTLRVFVEKHYSLWGHLKTETNINELLTTLKLIAKELIEGYSLSEEYNWAVAENLEWSGRQTKWVSATQRSYEFHGHEWRLPLWDPRFMEFWEGVPMKQKLDQKLYKETLTGNNWGNVWGNIKVNDKEISPASLRIARLLMKASFLLLGKERWKKFDRQFFSYFLDNTASTAIVPYSKVFFNSRGARNRNSWVTDKHLKENGIDLFGL